MKQQRKAGIILHPTSLPGPYGIGELGSYAGAFVDYLEKIGASVWQILPLNPVGYGNSPYSARSTFAGNELLISVEKLIEEGLIPEDALQSMPVWDPGRVDYQALSEWKMPLLMQAADRFLETKHQQKSYAAFCRNQQDWLEDYGIFMTITEEHQQDSRWYETWDSALADRDPAALKAYQKSRKQEIERWKVLQYLFSVQWMAVKEYAGSKGIEIFGDVPIFVSADSADTWTNRELFKTDSRGRFSSQAGVPPDLFSATGQLWGMPVYDWKNRKDELFAWWTRRMEHALKLTHIVRIDHFRGFQAYWDVPAGEKTAERGKWIKVPGASLFRHMKKQLGALPIIAEDLGVITPEVESLRDSFGLPGMKILQFAFDYLGEGKLNAENPYLPHNCSGNSVAYTGTHDNQTTAGWYASQGEEIRDLVRRYFARSDDDMVWTMIRGIMSSSSDTAIFPFQDLFCLGDEARMNAPSTVGSLNWSWRFPEAYLDDPAPAARFRDMAVLYGRIPTASDLPEGSEGP